MAEKLYKEEYVQDIADAIREVLETTETYKISEMGTVIRTKMEKKETHWWDDVSSLTTADIGTTREVTVNGVVHTVRLIGIDKDTIYGTSDKAHTTWEFVNLISDSNGYSLATFWKNTNNTSSANFDYLNSDIRKAIDGQGSGTANWFEKSATTWSTTYANKSVLDMLPSDLVSKLKTVSKIVNEKTSGSWVETTYSTNLFLLSPLEMGYSNQYAETTVTTYDYYVGKTEQTDASRIKQQIKGTDGALTDSTTVTSGAYTGTKNSYAGYNSATAGQGGVYWLRSPSTDYTNYAWRVYNRGSVNYDYVYNIAYGVSPCFCL